MYKPDNHTNSALGKSLIKSFNNDRNTNRWYTPDTAKNQLSRTF